MKNKKLKGWVAMNPNEFDIDNISFFTRKPNRRDWVGQDILPIEITFNPTKEPSKQGSVEEYVDQMLGEKNYTHSPLTIYRKELIEWINGYYDFSKHHKSTE